MTILDSFKLNGKVAVVTGANTGLGSAIAIALAQAGADIACVYRSTEGDTKEQIEALDRRYVGIKADLSKSTQGIIDQAVKNLGTVDILVNNAGTIIRNNAIDVTQEEWDTVLDVNLKSSFFLSQDLAKHLVASGKKGKIINIASMLSYQGGIRVPAYTASKSGITGITKALANEWAKLGINVNGIAPGYMKTNNTQALYDDPVRSAEILGRIPANRWGTPEDLMGAAVFLASEASDYLHGFVVAIDGGWLAR